MKQEYLYVRLNGSGSRLYYHDDKMTIPDCEDGHVLELTCGSKKWYLNGKLHREDGPAIELRDGSKEWYLNDKQLTEEEFNKRPQPKMANATRTIHSH